MESIDTLKEWVRFMLKGDYELTDALLGYLDDVEAEVAERYIKIPDEIRTVEDVLVDYLNEVNSSPDGETLDSLTNKYADELRGMMNG